VHKFARYIISGSEEEPDRHLGKQCRLQIILSVRDTRINIQFSQPSIWIRCNLKQHVAEIYFTSLISIRKDKKVIDSYVLYIIYDDFTAF